MSVFPNIYIGRGSCVLIGLSISWIAWFLLRHVASIRASLPVLDRRRTFSERIASSNGLLWWRTGVVLAIGFAVMIAGGSQIDFGFTVFGHVGATVLCPLDIFAGFAFGIGTTLIVVSRNRSVRIYYSGGYLVLIRQRDCVEVHIAIDVRKCKSPGDALKVLKLAPQILCDHLSDLAQAGINRLHLQSPWLVDEKKSRWLMAVLKKELPPGYEFEPLQETRLPWEGHLHAWFWRRRYGAWFAKPRFTVAKMGTQGDAMLFNKYRGADGRIRSAGFAIFESNSNDCVKKLRPT